MKVRDVLSVDVEDVVLGGKALARVEGQVVFVDRGLTGDRITARVTKTNRRSAEARLVTVEVPSTRRIAARCVHVDRCGGCRLQEPYEGNCGSSERMLHHPAGSPTHPCAASWRRPRGTTGTRWSSPPCPARRRGWREAPVLGLQ
jgi:predicted RNA-binding protein with TRAM domain